MSQPTLFSMTPIAKPKQPLPSPSPARITSSLKERAITVDHSAGYWEWKRRDRAVEGEVARSANVSKSAGQYHKNLFLGTDQPLEAVRTIVQKAREAHNNMTLPWAPSRSLLLNTNVLPYKQLQMRFSIDLDSAKSTLRTEWPRMISAASQNLGPLFNPEDYPPVNEVVSAAYIQHKCYPIADASDVRIDADQALVEEIRQQVRDDEAQTYNTAVATAWERLLTIIESATQNLSKGLSGKTTDRYRSEWHDNLSTLLPVLGGLNLNSDPRLDSLAAQAKTLLRPDPEEYRTSLDARAKAYQTAQRIYSDLSSIYGTLPGAKGK